MSTTDTECMGSAVRITGPNRKQREYLCRTVQLFLTLCTVFIRNSTASYSIANISVTCSPFVPKFTLLLVQKCSPLNLFTKCFIQLSKTTLDKLADQIRILSSHLNISSIKLHLLSFTFSCDEILN